MPKYQVREDVSSTTTCVKEKSPDKAAIKYAKKKGVTSGHVIVDDGKIKITYDVYTLGGSRVCADEIKRE